MFDLTSAKKLAEYDGPKEWSDVVISPNGKVAIVGLSRVQASDPNEALAIDLSTGKELLRIPKANARTLLFSADGSRLVYEVQSEGKMVSFYDIRRKQGQEPKIQSRFSWVRIACSPVTNIAAIGRLGVEGTTVKPVVEIFDIETARILQTLTIGTTPTGIAFSGDGLHLAVALVDGLITLWDTTTWKLHRTLDRRESDLPFKDKEDYYDPIALSHDGQMIAVKEFMSPGGGRSQLELWTVDSPHVRLLAEIDGNYLAFLPDGKVVFGMYGTPEYYDEPIRFYDPRQNKNVRPPFPQ